MGTLDLKLNEKWDLDLSSENSVQFTTSIAQAIKVRLQWFLGEWRLCPDMGIPYWEEVFRKNPNIERICALIRDAVLEIDGVVGLDNITVDLNEENREMDLSMTVTTTEEKFREEMTIGWKSLA